MEETTAKKGAMNPMLIAVIVIILLVGAAYVVIKSNKSKTAMQQPTPAPTMAMKMDEGSPTTAPSPSHEVSGTASGSMTDNNSNEVTVNMEAGSFYFKPNVITVKKGQKVKVVMHSVSMKHDFNIDELNVHMPDVTNGDTATVEFTADKIGTFEYYCGVSKHRQMGQVGKITVE